MKAGFTLHELLISLGIMGVVVGLAVHSSTGQTRFYRSLNETTARRGQLESATGITASVLWSVSPGGGDITLATDSTLELRTTIGSAVVCESTPGRVTIPAPTSSRGNVLSAFVESPEPDDLVRAFLEDSLGHTWLTFQVAAGPVRGGACGTFTDVASTWTVGLREPLVLPTGTALRFLRPVRLSLYRAADSRYYLGARDWNGASQRFNTIQPVAGPLAAYSPSPATGLRFEYLDPSGALLPVPADPSRVAGLRVVARVDSDSSVAVIGLRNPP
ncbi:MAG TPA: type II secretion system protein [Gemmatimonadaceae bacterium]|nr:type II secretion system protein [Gemmatimonadaceae bacterium]